MKNKWGQDLTPDELLVKRAAEGDMEPFLAAAKAQGATMFAESGKGNTAGVGDAPTGGLMTALTGAYFDNEIDEATFDRLYDAATERG